VTASSCARTSSAERARRRLLVEQPLDQVRQLGRQVGAQVGQARRGLVGVAAAHHVVVCVVERRRSAGHLDRDAREAIEVDRLGGRRIAGLDLAADDLRCEDLAERAERRDLRERQPPEDHPAILVDEDRRARDVADGDAVLVCARDRGDQGAQLAEVRIGAELLLELVAQQRARDALGDGELDAVVVAHAVHGHGARIAHGGAPARLGDQRRQVGVAPRELQRDEPVEHHVARLEDDSGLGPHELVADAVRRCDDLALAERAHRALPESGRRLEAPRLHPSTMPRASRRALWPPGRSWSVRSSFCLTIAYVPMNMTAPAATRAAPAISVGAGRSPIVHASPTANSTDVLRSVST
jgi:hypothetical protein